MPKEFLVALIGLAGVALSAIVSWLVSRAQVKAQIGKLRLEMQRAYVENLHKARLVVFPDLYSAVESHVKQIQRRALSLESLKEFYRKVDDWHTRNGYLLTAAANSVLYTFLRRLTPIAQGTPDSLVARLADDEKRRQLIRNAWEVELALKNDLGVFEVEFFDPERKFRSYRELEQAIGREDG